MGSEKLENCPCCGGTGRAREHDGKDWAICGRDECSMSTSWIPRAWWRASALRSRVSELESRASRAEARVVEIEAERAETEAKLAAVERRNGELVDAIGLALTWLGSAHISQGSNNMHRKVSVAEDILKFARKTPADLRQGG